MVKVLEKNFAENVSFIRKLFAEIISPDIIHIHKLGTVEKDFLKESKFELG